MQAFSLHSLISIMKLPFLSKQKKVPTEPIDNIVKIRIGVISLVGIIMALLLIFLYRDFYQTIVQARIVIVLKQEVSLKNIDLVLFRRVFRAHSYKTSPELPEVIYDPFNTTNNVSTQDTAE